jgi:predicted metal-dependent phosphoesterase TrpH
MKSKLFLATLLFSSVSLLAQNMNNVQMPEITRVNKRTLIHVPTMLGYQTLKCDFHMHTDFSDGQVWPTVRVDEAWQMGLDAIAITDHIENYPSKKFVGGDDNSSFDIAKPYADKKGIILIKGAEITRSMTPGHFNALFITNTNELDTPNLMDVFEAAKKQGAFIIWNHPGWKAQQPDTCKWWDIHTELLKKGMLHAVEVFNEQEYYPIAFDWCNEKGIAYIATSDIHGLVENMYDLSRYHRPMTLVLATERTEAALKEAMIARRTIAWFGNFLAGKEEFLSEFFKASLTIKLLSENPKEKVYQVINASDVPFMLKAVSGTQFTIAAYGESVIEIPAKCKGDFEVSNLIIRSNKRLTVKFPF